MARSNVAKNAVAVRPQGKSIANLEAEMAQEVATLKQQVASGGGRKLQISESNTLVTPEGIELGESVQLVIVDFTNRNYFYPNPYNKNNIVPPDCYSIGKLIADMKPENDSPQAQHDDCASCPLNQWGSGNGGTGKACKNTAELAVLLVDPDNPEAHNEPKAPLYSLSVPPTSLKLFGGFVTAAARSTGGTPVKVIVTLRLESKGKYSLLHFEDPVPNPDWAAHYGRKVEAQDLITRKPDFAAAAAKAQSRAPQRGCAPAPRVAAAGGRR